MATVNPRKQLLNDLAASSGRELGVTDWLTVSAAEADAFDIVTGLAPDFDLHPPGPVRPLPVNPFHLTVLTARFGAEVGFPTATDDYITALNYGFDNLTWHDDLRPGDQVRDRITVLDLTERAEDRYILRVKHVFENRTGGTVMTVTTRNYYLLLDPSAEANA
jgi:acyl dehydratase